MSADAFSLVRPLLLGSNKSVVGDKTRSSPMGTNVKVRITEKPRERELDGVSLDRLERGSVREVSSSIGSWLITQGYADAEMRQGSSEENQDLSGPRPIRDRADDRAPRRRSTD